MIRAVLLGPPGAGKGTQAARLSAAVRIPAISTGDLFRAHVNERTELGLEVEQVLATGGYVPDDVTTAMVRARLGSADAQSGFLLDGYPRTLAQVDHLDSMLEASGGTIDRAVMFDVDEDSIVRRLVERGEREGRVDDTEPTIRKRIAIYLDQTEPIIEAYRSRDLLMVVNARQSIDDVFGDALHAVRGAGHSSLASTGLVERNRGTSTDG